MSIVFPKESFSHRRSSAFLGLLGSVDSVVDISSLNNVLDGLHLLNLDLPGGWRLLLALVEQLLVRFSVRIADSVPQRGELTIVVVEVQVMHSVTCGTVNHWVSGQVLTVMDHHGPEVHKREQDQITELVKWEKEWVDVIWQGLTVTINWVEGMRCKWSCNQPLVMWLMKHLVNTWPVKPSMDQVDTKVGKHDERWVLPEDRIPTTTDGINIPIKLRVTLQLEEEPWHRESNHLWDRGEGHFHLKGHLVLQVSWMVEDGLVKDKQVTQGSHAEVEGPAKDGEENSE